MDKETRLLLVKWKGLFSYLDFANDFGKFVQIFTNSSFNFSIGKIINCLHRTWMKLGNTFYCPEGLSIIPKLDQFFAYDCTF